MKNRKLTIDPDFISLPGDDGDEYYPNGIFKFNITKLSEYISSNPGLFTAEEVAVKEIHRESLHINESHLDSVDISRPVILAEIAPGQYNLIDGNHRVEKAFRLGVEKIRAFRIQPEQHHRFISNRQGYEKYVDYWNQGLKEAEEAAKKKNPHVPVEDPPYGVHASNLEKSAGAHGHALEGFSPGYPDGDGMGKLPPARLYERRHDLPGRYQ